MQQLKHGKHENMGKEIAIYGQQVLCEASESQKSSFQTAQFEHVHYKDLGVLPAFPTSSHQLQN